MSVLVSGETASGKTTTLNAILPFIDHNVKIYSAEDTPEVKVRHKIWQRLVTRDSKNEESRVEMFDLLKAALEAGQDTSSSVKFVVLKVRQHSRRCRQVTRLLLHSTHRQSSR